MSKIIITGCTGNGDAILTQALGSTDIAHITTLSRRAPYPEPPTSSISTSSRLTSILIPSNDSPQGFSELPPALINRLKEQGHSAIIWALGISQTQVDKDEYLRITHDYTLAAARALRPLGTPTHPFRFIYISGEGADQSERAWTLFGRIKGRTEAALAAMQTESFQAVSLRPGAIVPTPEHAARMGVAQRYFSYAGGWFARTFAPGMGIASVDLGAVAVGLASVRGATQAGQGQGGTWTWARGWDQRTAEGWINNKGMNELLAARAGAGVGAGAGTTAGQP